MYVLKALRALYRTPGVGKYLSKNAPVQFWLSSYFHISGDPHQSLFGSRSKKKSGSQSTCLVHCKDSDSSVHAHSNKSH